VRQFIYYYFHSVSLLGKKKAPPPPTRWVLTKERVVLISERARGDNRRVRFARAACTYHTQPKSNFSTAAHTTKLGGGKVRSVVCRTGSEGMVSGEIGVGHVGCARFGWLAGRRARGPGGHHRRRLGCADGRTNCARVTDGRSTTGDGTGGGEAPFLSRDHHTVGGRKRRWPRPLRDAEHMRARPRPAAPT